MEESQLTLNQFVDKHKNDLFEGIPYWTGYGRRYYQNHFASDTIGTMRMCDITSDDIVAAYFKKQEEGYAGSTIYGFYAYLCNVFGLAKKLTGMKSPVSATAVYARSFINRD